MWDFDIGRTMGIMARTMPFILLRMAVYFGIALAHIVGTGGGAGRVRSPAFGAGGAQAA